MCARENHEWFSPRKTNKARSLRNIAGVPAKFKLSQGNDTFALPAHCFFDFSPNSFLCENLKEKGVWRSAVNEVDFFNPTFEGLES